MLEEIEETEAYDEPEPEPEPEPETSGNDTATGNDTAVDIRVVEPEDPNKKYYYYFNFLKNIVNSTYENLEVFQRYADDETVNQLDVEKTIMAVMSVGIEFCCISVYNICFTLRTRS